ncbi:MAG: hypothetical protein KDD55_04585 [Bdellovibrionales bacterium]|nr:hypothetical protein [Bdellovibrionales bacterium]
MPSYKLQTEHDSNPYRQTNEEPEHGPFFMIFCVYIPVIFLVFFVRAVMLYTGYAIIHLRVVDGLVARGTHYILGLLQ